MSLPPGAVLFPCSFHSWTFEYRAPVPKLVRKTISKKQRRPPAKEVDIAFPVMNAPFGAPRAYEPKQKLHTLVLDFKNENIDEDIQEVRELLTRLQARVRQLVKKIEPTLHAPISAAKKNLFIRPGKVISKKVSELECYPDQISLKLVPADVTYVNPIGEVLDLSKIDFDMFEPQVKVHLCDIWKYDGVYYPRLMVTACTLHQVDGLPGVWSDTECEDTDDDTDCMADDEASGTEKETYDVETDLECV